MTEASLARAREEGRGVISSKGAVRYFIYLFSNLFRVLLAWFAGLLQDC